MSMRLLLELLLLASDLSGYAVPPTLPTLVVVVPAEMPCACRGAHLDGQVWIDATLELDRPYGRSVVVHEFTHFLEQQVPGKRDSSTEQGRCESEAIDVQNRYLASQGVGQRAANRSRDE